MCEGLPVHVLIYTLFWSLCGSVQSTSWRTKHGWVSLSFARLRTAFPISVASTLLCVRDTRSPYPHRSHVGIAALARARMLSSLPLTKCALKDVLLKAALNHHPTTSDQIWMTLEMKNEGNKTHIIPCYYVDCRLGLRRIFLVAGKAANLFVLYICTSFHIFHKFSNKTVSCCLCL